MMDGSVNNAAFGVDLSQAEEISGERAAPRAVRYGRGWMLIRDGMPQSGRVRAYVTDLRFLREEGKVLLAANSRRYRVYAVCLDSTGEPFILKESWINPDYSWFRRMDAWMGAWSVHYGKRAMKGAMRLEAAGIASIRPVACWRYRGAWWSVKTYLLYPMIPSVGSVRDFKHNLFGMTPAAHSAIMKILLGKMADTLAAVHRAGLVHQDVASGNFLVCGDERMGSGDTAAAEACTLVMIDTDSVRRMWIRNPVLRRFFVLRGLCRLDYGEPVRRVFLRRCLGSAYNEFWWRVAEFWRRAGRRPLRALSAGLLGRRREGHQETIV